MPLFHLLISMCQLLKFVASANFKVDRNCQDYFWHKVNFHLSNFYLLIIKVCIHQQTLELVRIAKITFDTKSIFISNSYLSKFVTSANFKVNRNCWDYFWHNVNFHLLNFYLLIIKVRIISELLELVRMAKITFDMKSIFILNSYLQSL